MSKRVFVTVGSTRYPELIKAVLSSETIETLLELGYTSLCLQYGTDKEIYVEKSKAMSTRMNITAFDYSPSIEKEMQLADLIISHAGSGSVLEALRLRKLLLVVPNASLMDNHQAEVAKALSDEGYLLEATPSKLSQTLALLKDVPNLCPFPDSGNQKFARILDEELGLV